MSNLIDTSGVVAGAPRYVRYANGLTPFAPFHSGDRLDIFKNFGQRVP